MARGKKHVSSKMTILPKEEQPFSVPENWFWTDVDSINQYSGSPVDPMKQPDTVFELYSVPSSADDYPEILAGSEIGSSKQSVIKNDILLCKINPRINRVWKVSQHTDNELMASSEWIVVRNSVINSDYLMFCFRTQFFREFMLSNVSGVGGSLMRAQPKYVKKYPVPIAPIDEQQRIVRRIESLFAKLDEAKEKAQTVVDGFELRKSAILHKAFTGELTERWRKEHGVGLDNWEERNIQSVCAMKITDGTHKTPAYCEMNEGIPFISAKDVTSGTICWDNIKYIVPELHNELYKRLAPQIDDVLLAKNGTTGVAAIVEEEKIFDLYVTLAVLRPDKKIVVPRYLLNIINSPICKKQFDEHLTGIGVPNLHLRDIKEVLLNIPSLEEQREIVRIVDKITENEQQAKEAAEAVLDQIDTMKKAILARAFRGELGTNDPAEEWAGELVSEMLKMEAPTQPRAKAVFIPEELEKRLESELERKIIKLYLKSDSVTLSIDVLMAVSSKKFEVMDALRDLEQRGIIKKLNNGNYSLVR